MPSIMDYLLNNAKHFGSYGSDLPTSYLAPIVADEHAPDFNYSPAEVITKYPKFMSDAKEVADQFIGGLDNNPSFRSYSHSALPSAGITSNNVDEVDFINADLAKHYGMTKATAYQEALSNTAYQRAVKDMKEAGLNPSVLFGSGRAMPASASLYASEESVGSSGSDGRSSSSFRSSKSSDGKLFSSSAYSAISTIGGLVGMAVTKSVGGYWIGSSMFQGAMGLLDAVSKR